MGQQVMVEGDLIFRGVADHSNNIQGKPCTEKYVREWHFWDKTIDESYGWVVNGVNGAASTTSRPHNLALVPANYTDDDLELASDLMFYGKYNPCMEFRIRTNDITVAHWCCGFNDALSEDVNKLAVDVAAGGSMSVNATDFAGFVFDTDQTTANIAGISVNAGVDGAIMDTDHTEANDSWAVCRVELVYNGTVPNALFYFNSSGLSINPATDLIGYEANAVNASNALCIYMGALNRTATSASVEIDYIKVWQDLTMTET